MVHKKLVLVLILLVLLIAVFAHAAAQVIPETDDLFLPIRTIGANRPAGLLYEPNFDRFAWVDEDGQLVLVNAETLVPQRTLYTSGTFSAFNFSRNGQLLAVAIDLRIDIWDVESGVLVASFEPPGARRMQGPLQFTRNDELLVFDSIVPAPQELRRSENDTVILPWVWDIAAARDQRNSVLVNQVTAYPFYNIRVSMIAGDNGVLVSGLDNRIQIFDADSPTMEMIADIPTPRLEIDPLIAWRSATDPYLYISVDNYSQITQVNTLTNEIHTLEMGRDLDANGLERLRAFAFSRAAQPIGERGNGINPLAELLLGSDYLARQGYESSFFNLLDVLVPLADDPLSDTASGTILLTYNLNEQYGTGSADLLHPSGVKQLALSPDLTRLALRQSSGQIEVYRLETGALEQIITPSEPDFEGRYPLAFSGESETLVVDFERYDTATGERLARASQYTQPFDSFGFTADNDLLTFGGSPLNDAPLNPITWRVWDVETGQLEREDNFRIAGDSVLQASPDGLRYLSQSFTRDNGVELAITDAIGGSTDTFRIPGIINASINQIIPNDDWDRFMVVYSDNTTGSRPLAVYTRDGQRLYFDAGNNLPFDPYAYQWRDDRTIEIQTHQSSDLIPTAPTGLEYHPSGLPQCLVDALPEQWELFIPIWERLVYYQSSEVHRFTQKLCTALTGEGATNVNAAQGTPAVSADATAIVSLFTPTPAESYRSARTPAPIAVPGVPTCITTNYRSQAAAYADLWRQITASVTDPAQLAEINTMICEGLLGDLSGLQPTPTVNPDTLVVTTPTPMQAAPETTGGNENLYTAMLVDVITGERSVASNVAMLPAPSTPDIVTLLSTAYYNQYNQFPQELVTSPDGQFAAARAANGFITVYRLARSVPELLQDEQNAVATRAAAEPRSLGLAPTPSLAPQELGDALPTLTPTMTLTPVPLSNTETDLSQWGETQFICPARRLAALDNLPAGFTPPGTMRVAPLTNTSTGSFLWTLDPRTGVLKGDTHSPQCGLREECSTSPDGVWIVRQQYAPDGSLGDVIVSHIDGSQATTLYTAAEVRLVSPSFHWQEPHILQISYSGVLPTVSPDFIGLTSFYDPETRIRTQGALQPTPIPLGLLPFEVLSRQPYGNLELLVEHFAGGTRYYLRDAVTNQAQLFGQGSISFQWQPAGRFLYYQSETISYVYDTLTQQHTQLGEVALPNGSWSPDGHLLANWTPISSEGINSALMQGELPPRLQVWNTDTGLTYTYCLPELSRSPLGTDLVWSPDSRYIAFIATMQPDSDIAPTPTFAISPEAPPVQPTPIPLETQYEYQFPRTVVLDTVTGNAAIVSLEAGDIQSWIGDTH